MTKSCRICWSFTSQHSSIKISNISPCLHAQKLLKKSHINIHSKQFSSNNSMKWNNRTSNPPTVLVSDGTKRLSWSRFFFCVWFQQLIKQSLMNNHHHLVLFTGIKWFFYLWMRRALDDSWKILQQPCYLIPLLSPSPNSFSHAFRAIHAFVLLPHFQHILPNDLHEKHFALR